MIRAPRRAAETTRRDLTHAPVLAAHEPTEILSQNTAPVWPVLHLRSIKMRLALDLLIALAVIVAIMVLAALFVGRSDAAQPACLVCARAAAHGGGCR